jgi:antitoxin (DNA-binding transcriptional repressor) of toxin-antitoxin stability system
MIVSVNASVADFLLNAASYLRKVMEGEQVCLTNEGRVQARITPERACPNEQPVQEKIEQARRLKAQLAAKYSDDDWTTQDYLEAGRRA